MAKKKSSKDKKDTKKPDVHEELRDFDIRINEFGEIVSTYKVDKLNEFLNEKVEDKKLVNREDLNPKKAEEEE